MARLLNLFGRRRRRLEHELERELRYHLERRADELRASGATEAEAQRQAALEFGGAVQVREAVRETWTWRWVDTVARDLRDAARGLIRHRGFSLGAGLVLALAIGATLAMFTVTHAVLLRPLDYPDADRLVSLDTLWTNTGRVSPDVSGPDLLDWQSRSDVFEAVTAIHGGDDFAAVVDGRAIFVSPRFVSAGFFAVFGRTAAAGRLFSDADVPAGEAEPDVAVAGHHWAVAHFGSAEAAVGRSMTLYGQSLRIVGVAARGFRYPATADLWVPWRTENGGTDRGLHNYRAVGRLREDVDLARARAQLRAIGDELARLHATNRVKTATLTPLRDRITGDLDSTLWMLMAAVGVVWLVACANVASLVLARTSGRTREIALRTALGAGRRRVVAQLLTESLVLAGMAGLAGLLVAAAAVQGLLALSPEQLPRVHEVRIDGTILLTALGLTLASAAFVGLIPALHGSRRMVSEAAPQAGSRTTLSRTSVRLRSALVVTEVALSVMLLVTSGLLLRSFHSLQREELGFTTDRVLVAFTDYAVDSPAEIRSRSLVYLDLLDRLRAVPGVEAAAGIAFLPMGREPRPARDYFVDGRPEGRAGERPQAELYAVTPDYFSTLRIPLVAGRDFARSDLPDHPPVAIVSESLARTAFPGIPAVGQRIRTNTRSPWMEIVGVVGDTRWQDPAREPPEVIFVSSTQGAGKSLSILLRTSGDPHAVAGTLRDLLHHANPTVPVRFESMQELFDFALAYPRFRARVTGAFAGAAFLLATVGLFSVLAYLVGQRAKELAIRQALGARRTDVVALVVGHGVRLVCIGLVLGLIGALAASRVLAGLLYGIGPWDAATYAGTLALVGVASIVAVAAPAIRASRIAPVTVLQQE